MYYVSYITEYPIYEPAEGGYYYAGTTVQMCREFSTWKKANKFYQACRREFLEMWEYDKDRVYDNQWGGCGRWVHPNIKHSSKYIGESEWLEITRTKPVEQGWTPYC